MRTAIGTRAPSRRRWALREGTGALGGSRLVAPPPWAQGPPPLLRGGGEVTELGPPLGHHGLTKLFPDLQGKVASGRAEQAHGRCLAGVVGRGP